MRVCVRDAYICVVAFSSEFAVHTDPVLGNCFTFNHKDADPVYNLNRAGLGNGWRKRRFLFNDRTLAFLTPFPGFKALLQAQQKEYVPWFDTVALKVIIQNQDEPIFAESVAYYVRPGQKTNLSIRRVRVYACIACVMIS